MAEINKYFFIITLNVNGLLQLKDMIAEYILKEDLTICCCGTHLISKENHRLKVKRWKLIYNVNGAPKQAEVVILISEKAYFKPKLIRIEKEGHFILVERKIQQEDIKIVNIYAENVGTPDYIKHTLFVLKTRTPVQ